MENDFGFPPGVKIDAASSKESCNNGGDNSTMSNASNNASNRSDTEVGNVAQNGGEDPNGNELEHALLESIFYNEMIMMADNVLFNFSEDENINGDATSSASSIPVSVAADSQVHPLHQTQLTAEVHHHSHAAVQPGGGHVEIAPAPHQLQQTANQSLSPMQIAAGGPISIKPQPPRMQPQHIEIKPRQQQSHPIQPKPSAPIAPTNTNGSGSLHQVHYQTQQPPQGIRHNVQPQQMNGTHGQMPAVASSSQMHMMNGNTNVGPTNAHVPVQTINGQVYYSTTQPNSQAVTYSNANATAQSGNAQQQPINIQPAPTNIAPAPQPIAQRQPQLHGQHITILPQPSSNDPQSLAPNLSQSLPPSQHQSQYSNHPPQPTQQIQHHQNMQAQPFAQNQPGQPINRSNATLNANQAQYAQGPHASATGASAQAQYTQLSHHQSQHQTIQPAPITYQRPQQMQQQHHQHQHHSLQNQQVPAAIAPSIQSQQQHQRHLAPTPAPLPQQLPQHHQHLAPTPPPIPQQHSAPSPAPIPQHLPPFQNHIQPMKHSLTTRVSSTQQANATHLVNQFQTLASRLGIALPPNVLNDLTAAAAINETNVPRDLGSAIIANPVGGYTNMSTPGASVAVGSHARAPASSQMPSFMKQLQATAEAAICAVENRKRKQCDIELKPGPVPARRKKKATKEDCEQKLNQLKSENEMLQRHLDMVKNKTAKFEEERKAQEKKMKELVMLSSKGDNALWQKELKSNLAQFTETYSDYGKHRQEELFFHLNQLEKLAAPTTFTKMSLWTLGQSESFFTKPNNHPISSILKKELDITPAQARKILAERFKIQKLCSNLKEVLQLIADLTALCQKKQKVFSDRMSKCQEILAPEQVTKLLVWIDDNAGVLDKLCPGWGSERIREQNQSDTLDLPDVISESRDAIESRDANDSANDSVEKEEEDVMEELAMMEETKK